MLPFRLQTEVAGEDGGRTKCRTLTLELRLCVQTPVLGLRNKSTLVLVGKERDFSYRLELLQVAYCGRKQVKYIVTEHFADTLSINIFAVTEAVICSALRFRENVFSVSD